MGMVRYAQIVNKNVYLCSVMLNLFNKPTYKLGLAMSGGGARGFAHAGALLAFQRLGIQPDIVAGVSAGSVVAVMYAAGVPPKEILKMFQELKFNDLTELSVPKDGFFKLDKFKTFLRKHIPYRNIEDLPIPTVIGATDFDHGEWVAMTSGDIVECVTASCSIPIVFPPARINGVRYVDGGVLHNLPSIAIRDKCRYLIGINCSPLAAGHHKNNLMDIALRSYDLVARTNVVKDMGLCDLTIQTDEIAGYKVFNLKEIERVFRIGYRRTLDVLMSNKADLPSGILNPDKADKDAKPDPVKKA